MDIIELGAIGELVGGIAVVASLVYVGLQVRQSNRMEMAESVRASTRDYITTFHRMDPEVFSRGVVDFEELTAGDKQLLHQNLFAVFTVAQTEFSLAARGLSDPAVFETNANWLSSLIRTPGLRPWWHTINPLFDQAFRNRIEATALAQDRDGLTLPFHERLPWLSNQPLRTEA